MHKMNLQMFAEAVQGKKLVYLYRVYSEQATESGVQIAFTTDNERTKSKDADSTATKDGSIRVPGVGEVEITATSIMTKEDTMIAKLEDALDNDALLEIWEVNLDRPGTAGKYEATYYQGYITELDITSSAEDMVNVDMTFGINGDGVRGEATVTQEQQDMANYVFTDTQPTGA